MYIVEGILEGATDYSIYRESVVGIDADACINQLFNLFSESLARYGTYLAGLLTINIYVAIDTGCMYVHGDLVETRCMEYNNF